MSKKEVNPFNIAFLDLMSSALAAVIILFVIVPKSDIQIDLAESSIEEIKTGFDQVDSIILSWASFMSEEDIALLLGKTEKLQAEFLTLEELTTSLQSRLNETKLRNEQLTVRLNLAEKKLQELEKQIPKPSTSQPKTSTPEKAQQSKDAVASQSTPSTESPKQSQQSENTARVEGKGDFLFGLNPAFVAMIIWEDTRAYVDIYLKDERGILCDSYRRKTSFGQWVKMPRKFISTPNQAIIQNELVPGKYEVYAHLNRPRRGGQTSISGFVALNPEEGNPQKVDFGEITIESGPPPHKSGGGTLLGTVEVTANNLRWIKS